MPRTTSTTHDGARRAATGRTAPAKPRAAAAPAPPPGLDVERTLATGGARWIAGCDEVGRGALAGPVSVGMVVLDPAAVDLLDGVRDSKLLKAPAREALVPLIRDWAAGWGVGHAEASEIDEFGLVAALRLAGHRAWAAIDASVRPHAVLLDGNLDWLSAPRQETLLDAAAAEPAQDLLFGGDAPAALAPAVTAMEGAPPSSGVGAQPPPAVGAPPSFGFADSGATVTTRIKADMTCLSVAAASVLAKVERDALMGTYDEQEPHYGWAINKGYGTAAHRRAIEEHGATALHRRSWRLTGVPRTP